MQLSDFSAIVPIYDGWSGDKKYCVKDKNATKLFLRISSSEHFESKKFTYDMMCKLRDLGIPMCMPIDFGLCDEGVFLLESWIDGNDAGSLVPRLPIDQQYELGFKSGQIQRTIHSISALDVNWGEEYRLKIHRKMNAFLGCGVSFSGADLMLDYIRKNLHLLNDRPSTLQHGDFHRGNLMISHGNVYVIDFDRLDYGDPWEDLKAITWDVQLSPSFACGRIDGYFQGDVPNEFWRLLALYICVGTISSIPWAVPFGQGEINTMLDLANEVLHWYGDFSDPVPNWYKFEV